MKALITGFDAFGPHAFNPSGALAAALAERRPDFLDPASECLGLPTRYGAARALLTAALDRLRPDVALLFGLAASTQAIRLERFALNMNDAAAPDNAGEVASGLPIAADGPIAYATGFDLDPLLARLRGHGFDVVASSYAGGYVCNHAYYTALHRIAVTGLACKALFVHLPETPPEAMPRLERFATALLRMLRRQALG
jgi:pyroglutamyl-peptidase